MTNYKTPKISKIETILKNAFLRVKSTASSTVKKIKESGDHQAWIEQINQKLQAQKEKYQSELKNYLQKKPLIKELTILVINGEKLFLEIHKDLTNLQNRQNQIINLEIHDSSGNLLQDSLTDQDLKKVLFFNEQNQILIENIHVKVGKLKIYSLKFNQYLKEEKLAEIFQNQLKSRIEQLENLIKIKRKSQVISEKFIDGLKFIIKGAPDKESFEAIIEGDELIKKAKEISPKHQIKKTVPSLPPALIPLSES
ncbi:hypothetical protein GF376_00605 [Candidatus Peregrinibacteria bacterium]|nr:hypothetical protein [Candidatus Peregrinibacteria bacterium]